MKMPEWSPERLKELADAESEALDATGGLLAISPELYRPEPSMTPIPPIPEDLQESYAYLKTGTMTTKAKKLVHYWSDDRICGLIERIAKLNEEVERLREINIELVHTHNTLVVENARQERAIWKFSGDPRAEAYRTKEVTARAAIKGGQ